MPGMSWMGEKALWNISDGRDDNGDGDDDDNDDDNHLDPCQACWCQGWSPPEEPSSSACARACESSTSRCGPQCLRIWMILQIHKSEMRKSTCTCILYGYQRSLIWNNENYKTACVVFWDIPGTMECCGGQILKCARLRVILHLLRKSWHFYELLCHPHICVCFLYLVFAFPLILFVYLWRPFSLPVSAIC